MPIRIHQMTDEELDAACRLLEGGHMDPADNIPFERCIRQRDRIMVQKRRSGGLAGEDWPLSTTIDRGTTVSRGDAWRRVLLSNGGKP